MKNEALQDLQETPPLDEARAKTMIDELNKAWSECKDDKEAQAIVAQMGIVRSAPALQLLTRLSQQVNLSEHHLSQDENSPLAAAFLVQAELCQIDGIRAILKINHRGREFLSRLF